ncbi:response regulator transcription factor [Sphingomonas solaris]|uniref:Response regulator transcription factor n=1 Tax=Alterirhizorhabdus solaris TaxID=2529389 RepID=A0A558QY42_9SPHN|nr:response regulator transcription factor [Sphingomonas solaris]TVV72019.1 response regulator transcription factor [Sphingomonas solaris]
MPDKPLLMIVEDDAVFARTLCRSFERREYAVVVADGPAAMERLLASMTPDYAVVDLKLAHSSGLACVERLHAHGPATVIIVLTGYASIATAVEAIKLGATSYLAKPANTDDIERAFGMTLGDPDVPIDGRQTSIKTIEWERINEVLADTGFNVSETARRLGMHRRTLARKLEKRHIH